MEDPGGVRLLFLTWVITKNCPRGFNEYSVDSLETAEGEKNG